MLPAAVGSMSSTCHTEFDRAGRVERIDKGGWLKVDHRLVVGGRDRSKLVDGVKHQTAEVREVLDGVFAERSASARRVELCRRDFGLIGKPFAVGEVLVIWSKALRARLLQAGPLDERARAAIHACLASKLPPARI